MHNRNPETGLYEVIIDGRKYEFSKWGAEEAVDVLLDLGKITGRPFATAISGMFGADEEGKKGLDKKVSPEIFGEIVGALMDRLDKNLCKFLIKKFASDKCWCDGAKINFDSHYQDKLDVMFKVIRAALEVQYGNFFSVFQGATGVRLPSPVSNRVQPT